MPKELKTLTPDPTKGTMLVDILRCAMSEADSGYVGQRAKRAKYIRYPHDHHVVVYFTTNTVVVPLEEDQEPVAMEVEEDAMVMIVRAPDPGH
ncbi:hypothetical protein D1007_59302 [Hordeum vulgare]|nr:hypothetical protein D1007_59302 [Hordeum vulgare]